MKIILIYFRLLKDNKNVMMVLLENFSDVKDWLTSSGIFISNSSDQQFGGVHSFYDVNSQKFGFLYPEITGYFVSTSCFLHLIENNDKYLTFAKNASDWLVNLFEKNNGIIQKVENNDSDQKFVYSFDTAICAKGLIDYYNFSKNKKYLDYAKKMVLDLENAINDNGTVKPFRNLNETNYQENNSVWYKKTGCFHIKTSMAIFELYQLTGEENYLKTANHICNSIISFQNDNGSILLHQNESIINLHTLCYSLEGLIFAYYITKNEKFLESVKNAIYWCIQQIDQNDGSIMLWFNSKHKSKAAYPIAQLIRIMLLLNKLENQDEYRNEIKTILRFLLTLQSNNNNSRLLGGFYEEYFKTVFSWKKRQRINSWTSMFALQAIYWNEKFDELTFDNMIKSLY